MTGSKNLSNYDGYLKKMLKDSKLLIIDLDGTLIDFEKIDNIIIKEIFPDSRIIDTIDNILWKINRLDILGNGYTGLKLRLEFYSLFSKYSYKECKSMYGSMYEELARIELLGVYATSLVKLIDDGYEIAIVTKNVYAKNLLDNHLFKMGSLYKEKLHLVILRNTKKKKQFREMVENSNGKVCVIGNNFSDDLLNSYRIGSPYIYIGNSKAIKYIMKLINGVADKFGLTSIYNRGIQLRNFRQVVDVLKKK